ncbi:MAG: dihydrofolate reductase [uncultured bacterium]|nr:MAG: dihydrofolate reductase [uncultured bacterium]OGT32871.1 MAG: dihydrofolate reductase [Gammaproteobacteria bacterium RIFCSPHIGHO2_02_FULL_39_13]OGT50529.1 MAG: dihydrofolate reductase [Gammaproteobacteria bacterium RIFCSPHIGHO2_12_FULL_39_24]
MKISIIVAKSKNNVIGKNNQLPWYLPADLHHFKSITMGKPIIMGRKTAESIGKPLPGRRNIIITRDKNFHANGCDVVHSIDDALNAVKTEKEVMIIGGANLYSQFLPRADCIYMTIIDAELEGDIFFPELNSEWKLTSEEKFSGDEKNKYAYRFLIYRR